MVRYRRNNGKRINGFSFSVEGYHFQVRIYVGNNGNIGNTCVTRATKPQKEYNKFWRTRALEFLGGKCSRCGEKDWRVLQINHINNDGKMDRKQHGEAYFCKDIVENQRKDVDLLCANCNIRYMYETNQRKRWVK